MTALKEIGQTTSIVLLGNFNPLIFKPDWFAKHQLIGEDESAGADIEIIHREISAFRLEWLALNVQREKLVAQTDQPPGIKIHDLILGSFGILADTPVNT